jgi:hypothetical protein
MVLMASSKESTISFMIVVHLQFLSMGEAGIESLKLPPREPNLNAYAERFVRTIKEGCLDQMIFFGEDSLRPLRQLLSGGQGLVGLLRDGGIDVRHSGQSLR